jgi:hypothetical protein
MDWLLSVHVVTVTLFWLSSRCIHYAACWMIRFPFGASNFYGLRNVQPRSVVHSASYSLGAGACRWYIGHGMNLTAHLHLVPTLTVSGALLLRRPYAFLACLWTTLPLPTPNISSMKQTICEYNPIQLQHLFKVLKFFSPTNAHFIKHIKF